MCFSDRESHLLTHMIGDYLLQSDYMAQEKTKSNLACFLHALTYTIPFLRHTKSPVKLFKIGFSHFIIDRFRLARYVVYFKNQLAPKKYRYKWKDGDRTGYKNDSPVWLSLWLMIIADNVMHMLINERILNNK